MFAQPNWFRPKSKGWGLVPITWQGWLYTGLWTAAIAAPFSLLLARHQPVEALTWMGLGLGALVVDVHQTLRLLKGLTSNPTTSVASAKTAAQPREDNVLYILDNSPAPVATRNFNLQMRR
jgi:hypothetical protein